MNWYLDGEACTVTIDYKVDGDFVIPTEARMTMRDQTGSVVSGLQDTPLAVDSSSVQTAIPSSANQLPSGNETSAFRFIQVVFSYQGEEHRLDLNYGIRPFVPFTSTCQDVRSELGLDFSELPDPQIDLYRAYLLLQSDYDIYSALTSGDATGIYASQAIAIKAAIECTSSLHFRAAVKIKSEDNSIERKSDFSVEHIQKHLGERLSRFLDLMEGVDTPTIPSLVVATPTDAITGE